MNWIPCHEHSHFSLLDAVASPKKIIQRCSDLEMKAAAITDHGSCSASIAFEEAATKAGIKPIQGCELYLCDQKASIRDKTNPNSAHLVVLAKNKLGWKKLMNILAESNKPENFYSKPRLSLDELAQFCDGNLIGFSGHPGSSLASVLFTDYKKAYASRSAEEVRSYLYPDHIKRAERLAYKFREIFGKENFFIEIQLIDRENFKAADTIAGALREVADLTKIPTLATADSHYAYPEDAPDQRVLLCSSLNTNFSEVNKAIENGEEIGLGGFFRSNKYYIPSPQEMGEIHKGFPEELANSLVIADMCESYTLLSDPKKPRFACPNNMSEGDYFKDICRDGWRKKISPLIKGNPELAKVYAERINYEFDTLLPMDLAGYFLIVNDYLSYIKNQGGIVGKARGSAGGCLVSYLSDIIEVNPVEHGLYFERFFNAGRKNQCPDIDSDFEPLDKIKVQNYIREKYKPENTANIVNFGRMQGRSALKEVLRVHSACSFDEANRITEWIPDEAAISDQLQEMIDEGLEPSIIAWALENHPKELSEWCEVKDDGSFRGPLAQYFTQAKRLEGVKKSAGKHASGFIISSEPLADYIPMIRDKSSDNLLVGYEGVAAEKAGLLKFDLLSTKVNSVIHDATKTLAKDYSYGN